MTRPMPSGRARRASSAMSTTTARSGPTCSGTRASVSGSISVRGTRGVGHQRGASALHRRAQAVATRADHAGHARRDACRRHAAQSSGGPQRQFLSAVGVVRRPRHGPRGARYRRQRVQLGRRGLLGARWLRRSPVATDRHGHGRYADSNRSGSRPRCLHG